MKTITIDGIAYTYHHTATARGYVSRKNAAGIVTPYSGRFGEGVTVDRPRKDTTRYIYRDYYLK